MSSKRHRPLAGRKIRHTHVALLHSKHLLLFNQKYQSTSEREAQRINWDFAHLSHISLCSHERLLSRTFSRLVLPSLVMSLHSQSRSHCCWHRMSLTSLFDRVISCVGWARKNVTPFRAVTVHALAMMRHHTGSWTLLNREVYI